MIYPFGQTVTLTHRVATGVDTYGNDVYTTTTATAVGAFAPGGSVELTNAQDLVTTQPAVYLPAGTTLAAVDTISVAGVVYQVDGVPSDWHSPFTGWDAGMKVSLKRVDG